MSSFTEPLVLEALASETAGRGEFLLYLPFNYDVGFLGSGDTITVPKGFKTDLASVPALARPFVPLSGRMAKPAILHDWLLAIEDPRAHEIFEEALRVAGLGKLRSKLLATAVKLWAEFKNITRKLR